MNGKQEILGPAITDRGQADIMVQHAVSLFNEAKRATIQVMADIRRLQDRQVHTLYGYGDFGRWAADTFEGMKAGNVRQLARAGAVALELDRRKLIDLDNPKGVGTTGLRELATIAGKYGNDHMASVFITCVSLIDGTSREVSGSVVEAAMRLLMPVPVVELESGLAGTPDVEIEDEPDTEYGEKVQELIEHIRDLSYDLPESLAELHDAIKQLTRQFLVEKADVDQQWIEGTR